MNAPYPWQAAQWRALERLGGEGRLGHALLLSGREGTGTDALGRLFARRQLCESPAGAPCGTCRACVLFAADSHPDFRLVAPAEEGKPVTVDQIRELTEYYALTPHYDRGKLTLIAPADTMNRAAANALLKLLEEPPDGALLILVANRFSDMPMTIRSRCVRIPCEHIDRHAARHWLQAELGDVEAGQIDELLAYSGGAPLLARDIARSDEGDRSRRMLDAVAAVAAGRTHALDAARGFGDLSPEHLIRLFLATANRLVLAKFNCRSYYDESGGAPDPRLQGLADHLNLKHLYAFLDLIFETRMLLARHGGLREADIVDSLWLGLEEMTGRGT